MPDLLQRLFRNAARLQSGYATSYQLLDVAATDAMPWVLGLPAVQSRLPGPLASLLGRGRPVRLEDIELLTTRLLAILMASEPRMPETAGLAAPPVGAAPPDSPSPQADAASA